MGKVSQMTVPGGRSCRVEATVTPEQKTELETRAGNARVSVSKYLVDAALGKQAKSQMNAAERRELLVALMTLRADLAHVGSNINQLAKVANTLGPSVIDAHQVDGAVRSVMRLLDVTSLRVGTGR